jgi:hypothetical protein
MLNKPLVNKKHHARDFTQLHIAVRHNHHAQRLQLQLQANSGNCCMLASRCRRMTVLTASNTALLSAAHTCSVCSRQVL